MNRLIDRLRAHDADRGPVDGVTLAEAALAVIIVSIAVVGWVALTLASADALNRWSLFLAFLAFVAAVGVVIWRFPPPPVVIDHGDLVILGAAVLAAIFFIPGSEYLFADKDPGVYSTHAFAIARAGSTEIPDPFAERLPAIFDPTGFGGRFPGYWYAPDDNTASLPQFFHMFPSLLGASKLALGSRAVLQMGPLIGIVSVAAFTAAARRAFGTVVAAVTGVLMATNMLDVFFGKYPGTETLAQLLYGGTALLLLTALRTNWAPAALGAGMLATLTFLNRPDGVLFMLLAVGALGLGIAFRSDRRLLIAGAVGLALPMASVWYQAYERNTRYAEANSVPSDLLVAGLIVLILAGAFVLRRFAPKLVGRVVPLSSVNLQRLAVVTTVVVGAWIVFGAFRSKLTGIVIQEAPGRPLLYTLDEKNLERLFWFFSPAGLALFGVGVVVLVVVHRKASTWLLVGPGLALLPVYVWRARISPRLMWWGRRFVPLAVPAIVLAIAVAAVWLLLRHGRGERLGRAVAAVLLTIVIGAQLYQSVPLIGFREYEGSGSFISNVDSLAGADSAVYLWEAPIDIVSPSRNAAGPLWFMFDRASATLPVDPTQDQLDAVVTAFPDHRIILLTHEFELPPGIDTSRLQRIGPVTGNVELWDESLTIRPATSTVWPIAMAAWELDPEP